MSTCYRTLRRIEDDANAALCQLNGQTAEGRTAQKYFQRISKACNKELAKTPLARMKMRELLRRASRITLPPPARKDLR